MPNAMQPKQACDKMQTSKHAECNQNIQTCMACKDGQASNNMQTSKHATICNMSSMQQRAKMDLNQNGQTSAMPKNSGQSDELLT